MDKTKSTYLIVAINVAVLLIAAILFFVVFGKKSKADPNGGDNASGISATTGGTGGGTNAGRNTREAQGARSDSVIPVTGPNVRSVHPVTLPEGESWVPQIVEMPQDTLEKTRETRWLIKNLILACELYKTRNEHYPPTELAADDRANDTNLGAESLLAHLEAAGLVVRVKDENWIGNTDDDYFPEDYRILDGKPKREGKFEILDAWGNPLVYIRHDRYPTTFSYTIKEEVQEAAPQISQLAVEYHAKRVIEEHLPRREVVEYHAREFVQIWSAGPNGINENGGGDDVTSWHIRE